MAISPEAKEWLDRAISSATTEDHWWGRDFIDPSILVELRGAGLLKANPVRPEAMMLSGNAKQRAKKRLQSCAC